MTPSLGTWIWHGCGPKKTKKKKKKERKKREKKKKKEKKKLIKEKKIYKLQKKTGSEGDRCVWGDRLGVWDWHRHTVVHGVDGQWGTAV